jgi:hypothetical protein
MIKSRMRWAGHVKWGEEERVYVGSGKAIGKESARKTKTSGWIILGWIL